MCNCTKIKEMMNESKESGKAIVLAFDGGTLFVEYCEHYDEFTFQYSWNIDEDENVVIQEVKQELCKYSADKIEEFDVIQLGLVTVYNTNQEYICKAIQKVKNSELETLRDTKYVFMGNKVLRVVQYFGMYSNPFDCINSMVKWNQPEKLCLVQNQVATNVTSGLEYYHLKEDNSVIFSFGSEGNRMAFEEQIIPKIPLLFTLDNLTESMVYQLKK